MIARWLRRWEPALLEPLVMVARRFGIGPNAVTAAGLVTVILSGLALSGGHFIPGACLLLLGGFLDACDGQLARVLGEESPFGAFLDSVSDHCGDFAVYLGLLSFFLDASAKTEVLLIFAASFGSIFGSQVRSRAEAAGIRTGNIGLFTRFERVLVLSIGLFWGPLTASLWVLAVFNNVSAAQRFIHAFHARGMQISA